MENKIDIVLNGGQVTEPDPEKVRQGIKLRYVQPVGAAEILRRLIKDMPEAEFDKLFPEASPQAPGSGKA